MKISDALVGAVLTLLGVAIALHVRGFPAMPGQKFGAAVFPGVIAAGLIVCGTMLLVRGIRRREASVTLAAWMRSPALASNFIAVCGALVFYILAADRLGFILTGTLLLLALFLKFGVPAARSMVIAVVATLVIHALFYKLLRVALPWGVLAPVAW